MVSERRSYISVSIPLKIPQNRFPPKSRVLNSSSISPVIFSDESSPNQHIDHLADNAIQTDPLYSRLLAPRLATHRRHCHRLFSSPYFVSFPISPPPRRLDSELQPLQQACLSSVYRHLQLQLPRHRLVCGLFESSSSSAPTTNLFDSSSGSTSLFDSAPGTGSSPSPFGSSSSTGTGNASVLFGSSPALVASASSLFCSTDRFSTISNLFGSSTACSGNTTTST